MLIVFDLDHTLFDALKFKDALAENFNPYKHVSYLISEGKIDSGNGQKIKIQIINLLKRADNFVFSGAESILENLKEGDRELVLLTFGDIVWQKMKIKNLAIKNYFNRIIITDKSKITALDAYKNYSGRKIMINDNAQENKALKKELPDWEIYLVDGPYADVVEHGFKKYTLKQVLKHLI